MCISGEIIFLELIRTWAMHKKIILDKVRHIDIPKKIKLYAEGQTARRKLMQRDSQKESMTSVTT